MSGVAWILPLAAASPLLAWVVEQGGGRAFGRGAVRVFAGLIRSLPIVLGAWAVVAGAAGMDRLHWFLLDIGPDRHFFVLRLESGAALIFALVGAGSLAAGAAARSKPVAAGENGASGDPRREALFVALAAFGLLWFTVAVDLRSAVFAWTLAAFSLGRLHRRGLGWWLAAGSCLAVAAAVLGAFGADRAVSAAGMHVTATRWTAAALFFGLGIGAGLWPVHSALRGVWDGARSPRYLRGLLVVTALLGWLRIGDVVLPDGLALWSDFLVVLALITVTWAGMRAQAVGSAADPAATLALHTGFAVLALCSMSTLGRSSALLLVTAAGAWWIARATFVREHPVLRWTAAALPGSIGFWGVLGALTAGLGTFGKFALLSLPGWLLVAAAARATGAPAPGRGEAGDPDEGDVEPGGGSGIAPEELAARAVGLSLLILPGLWPGLLRQVLETGVRMAGFGP